MFYVTTSGIHPIVVAGKGCQEKIPAPIQTMPDAWIVADCPFCGAKRWYLPAEIFQGRLSHGLLVKLPSITDRR